MLAKLRSANGYINWPVLISAASLMLALFGGLWAAVQSQINTVKELTANDRQAIRRQLEENDRVTANIRSNKVDIERYTSEASAVIRTPSSLWLTICAAPNSISPVSIN